MVISKSRLSIDKCIVRFRSILGTKRANTTHAVLLRLLHNLFCSHSDYRCPSPGFSRRQLETRNLLNKYLTWQRFVNSTGWDCVSAGDGLLSHYLSLTCCQSSPLRLSKLCASRYTLRLILLLSAKTGKNISKIGKEDSASVALGTRNIDIINIVLSFPRFRVHR